MIGVMIKLFKVKFLTSNLSQLIALILKTQWDVLQSSLEILVSKNECTQKMGLLIAHAIKSYA